MRSATKKLGVAILALTFGTSGQAKAGVVVSFTSTGSFSSSGTAVTDYSQANAEVELKYTPFPQTISAPANGVEIGTFVLKTLTAGSNNTLSPDNDDFTLVLTQTSPSAPGHTFTSDVSGSVQVKNPSGDLTITFNAPLFATFGNETYTINPSTLTLAAPSGVGQTTSANLFADITVQAAVPEPSTFLTSSLVGLAGLGYSWRRRKAKAAA